MANAKKVYATELVKRRILFQHLMSLNTAKREGVREDPKVFQMDVGTLSS